MTLDEIAIRTGTDKSSLCHNYCTKYERWLPFAREAEFTLLEVGVRTGASLAMWREFYPNAKIVGIDIDPSCSAVHAPEMGIHVEIGSQDDPNFLRWVAEKHGPFDMVLDDASHLQHHVVTTFLHLWPHTNSTYVVEDCCTSYWPEWNGGLRREGSMVEFFKKLIDEVNFMGAPSLLNPIHARREDGLAPQFSHVNQFLGHTIEGVHFLNGIIILSKRMV